MNTFLSDVSKHIEHLEELSREGKGDAEGKLPYSMMNRLGILKPYTVRLPVSLIAQLDELKQYTPYSSMAEMVNEMLTSSLYSVVETLSDSAQDRFQTVADEALEKVKPPQSALIDLVKDNAKYSQNEMELSE